jgi:hypothetical protein
MSFYIQSLFGSNLRIRIEYTALHCTMVGKLLLYCKVAVLLYFRLLVKETRYFKSVIHSQCNESVTFSSYCNFKCNKIVACYYDN